ncbi:MAG: general secretion pathway protein GspB [Gammaproteobacteria bacterium]|nr:general secretion pathway protein GspB [Gammaproteobacteria bacterium]MDH3536424.1 general secretion pathway protein GspB [Gammaproteobacteria bacterium]
MSFILDAIAKSEQERQQQEMPDARVLTLPAVPARQPRRLLPFLLVTALLVNAVVIVIWMQSEQVWFDRATPTQQNNRGPGNVQEMVADNQTASDQALLNGVMAEITTSEKSPEISNTAAGNELPASRHIATPSSAGETADVLVSEPETKQPEPRANVASGDTTAWIRSDPDTLLNKTQPVPEEELQGLQSLATMPRKVSSLSELPSAVRNDLPKVTFSGHLYSGKPGLSVVFVDGGRPVAEGRRIVDELFLHEITPAGVIVEFRGYLIEVGILQNWTLD